MSFKSRSKNNFLLETMNTKDVTYLLSLLKDETEHRKLQRIEEKINSNMEAFELFNEFERRYLAIKADYSQFNETVNAESFDTTAVMTVNIIQSKLVTLANDLGRQTEMLQINNFEDIEVNLEGLFSEIGNMISQGFKGIFASFSRMFKSLSNLFSTALGVRRRKLTALKQALGNANENVSKQKNDEFVENYLGILKLANFDLPKAFGAIDPLLAYVKSMISGKYPSDGIGADVDISTAIPEVKEVGEDITGFTTYRNYQPMNIEKITCLGYKNKGDKLKTFLTYTFSVPKDTVYSKEWSLRTFGRMSFHGINIMDDKNVYIRVNQMVDIDFKPENKTIKFSKALAISQIDKELARINTYSVQILKSTFGDIWKVFQGYAGQFATVFDKAVPMGIVAEFKATVGAAMGTFLGWFLNILFSKNTFADWLNSTYVMSYTGLIEMSKSNYEMLVDYCEAMLDNE